MAIELGNDINAVDKNGETAMHGAAYWHMPRPSFGFSPKRARGWMCGTRPTNADGRRSRSSRIVQRGMNIVNSPTTADAIRQVMTTGKSSTLTQ